MNKIVITAISLLLTLPATAFSDALAEEQQYQPNIPEEQCHAFTTIEQLSPEMESVWFNACMYELYRLDIAEISPTVDTLNL